MTSTPLPTGGPTLTATARDRVVDALRGDGLEGLTVPERATIANMGAELGLTTSVFPSDAMTRRFLGVAVTMRC